MTGGAGFIGSNFVRYYLRAHPEAAITVLDALTYAGRRENLVDLEESGAIRFVPGDIRDPALVASVMTGVDHVVHLAAESHVDRSILGAEAFLSTNILGTHVLLQAACAARVKRFLHVSTDEVYGSVAVGAATEDDRLRPTSPYAASKASADLLALAHHATFGTPVVVTRSCNNFGPYQHPEKLIPLFITNALQGLTLPLYGDGLHVRDWLFVEDHCIGLDLVLQRGEVGGIYNLATGQGRTNLDVTEGLIRLLKCPSGLVRGVEDRQGHDRRYSVDVSRAQALGWAPRHDFEEALALTVAWYRDHEPWWRAVREDSSDFERYYSCQYGARLASAPCSGAEADRSRSSGPS